MKKNYFKLTLTVATSAVVMLGGVTAGNAAELQLAAQQPTIAGEISTDTNAMYLVRLADPAIAITRVEFGGSRQPVPRQQAKNAWTPTATQPRNTKGTYKSNRLRCLKMLVVPSAVALTPNTPTNMRLTDLRS